MDNTQQSHHSRSSDATGATRKRRSSILKSQRPPRTPFSELEFHVATPTDTAKSRRVSFSNRKVVAEFATNEATTTWKHFYEEHNKSLESSGNEGVKSDKQSVGHIGKRIFDEQFEEIEAVDFITSLDSHSNRNFNHSINNVNITEQLASLEFTAVDKSMPFHQQRFEMSEMTDNPSQVFIDGNIPTTSGILDTVDVSFPSLQPVGDEKDDLDAIQEDLKRAHSNVMFPDPFSDKRDMSEYIEVDFNATHISIANNNEESDMSITDTIHSPKVQEISRNRSSIVEKKMNVSKKSSLEIDWVTDKENIAVFDKTALSGPEKRKSVAYVNDLSNISMTQAIPSNIIIPNDEKKSEKRQTIVFDTDIGDLSVTRALPSNIISNKGGDKRKSVLYDNANVSVTQAIPSLILSDKNKTVVSEDDFGNISITQAVPIAKILTKTVLEPSKSPVKQNVTLYEDAGNISETQVIPQNIISNIEITSESRNYNSTIKIDQGGSMINLELCTKRKSINQTHDQDVSNISITQAVPANIIVTNTFADSVNKISSEANSEHVPESDTNLKDHTNTITINHDLSSVSFTHAVPNNVILSSKVKPSNNTVEKLESKSLKVLNNVFSPQSDGNNRNGSQNNEKRRTIVFDSDINNLSITQAIPKNIILSHTVDQEKSVSEHMTNTLNDKDKTGLVDAQNDKEASIYVIDRVIDNIRRKTYVYEDDNEGNMSITEAIPPTNIMDEIKKIQALSSSQIDNFMSDSKRKSVLYENDSERKSINNQENIINEVKCDDSFKNDDENGAFNEEERCIREKTALIEENDDMDMSIGDDFQQNLVKETESNKTVVYGDHLDVSMTEAIEPKYCHDEVMMKSMINEENLSKLHTNKSFSQSVAQDVLVYQAVTSKYDEVNDKSSKGDAKNSENKNDSSHSTSKSFDNELYVDENKELQIDHSLKQIEDKTMNVPILTNEAINGKENFPIISSGSTDAAKSRQTILDDLLDMSQTSLEVTSEKKLTTDKIREVNEAKESEDTENKDSVIVGMKLIELEKTLHSVDYKDERSSNVSVNVMKNVIDASPPKYNTEKLLRSSETSVENSPEKSKIDEEISNAKSFDDANDTKELLEMLSNLTDKSRMSKSPKESKDSMKPDVKDQEPRRLSVAPNRLSIVFSREDLINNISMAQAALQRSIESDESNMDTSLSPPEEVTPPKKEVRVSNEVVKKLHFEDESVSDLCSKTETKSLLKKTAFGESEFMKDCKAKVIPSYLKDVTNEIKSLMSDLVKPNVDLVPFHSTSVDTPLRDPSTCSTQIQANLVTSSQIDMDADLYSGSGSNFGTKTSDPSYSDTKSIRSSLKSSEGVKWSPIPDSGLERKLSPKDESKEPIIVFDPTNPLNNVLIAPVDYSKAHKYQPISNESCDAGIEDLSRTDASNTTTVGTVMVSQSKRPSESEKIIDAQSSISVCKSTSIHGDFGSMRDLKDSDINTVITMKKNKELLDASSSLTLVDDAVPRNALHENPELDPLSPNSPVKLIYKNEEQTADDSGNKDSDFTSNEEMVPVKITKAKKRNHSPNKKDRTSSNIEVTPKPASKIQKRSLSPNKSRDSSPRKSPAKGESVQAFKDNELCHSLSEISKSSRKPKSIRPGTDMTVQQLITEYDLKPNIDDADFNKQILEALSRSTSPSIKTDVSEVDEGEKTPDVVSSFTSSKNQNEMRDASSVTTTDTLSSLRSSKHEWQTEKDPSGEELDGSCESSVNVVAKIDMLPFMGSHICEWEAWGTDTWTFRLLHGRLRLSVKLAHRHHNSARTRVRADTPVLALAVETAHIDKKNSVALLCVNFAAQTMRYFANREWQTAGEIPALMRKCASVARVALKWGRAMHEARLQLAYALSSEGGLALKVANIPLRSVWEVTMRLELVVENPREVPWPRASDVKVARVVSDVHITDEEVAKVIGNLPQDWGHVPRTVWKIFRYLKNKSRDEEVLGL